MELARRHGRPIVIQHALNGNGEHKVPGTNYRLDGFAIQGIGKIAGWIGAENLDL